MAFPGTYNFSYYKGDTYQFRIYPKDSSGALFDLTKFANSQTGSVQFTIADKRGSAATKTVLCSAVISDQSILCTVRPVDGEKLTAGTPYVYDVEIQDKSNPTYPFIYTVLTGNISVTDQVTTLSSVPLTAPTNLVVTPTSTTAALTWTAPSSGNAFGYYVAYGDLTNSATAAWVAEKTAGGATPSSSDFLIALSQGLFVAVNTNALILSTSTTVTGLTNATADNKYLFIVAPTKDSSVTLPPNIGPVVYKTYVSPTTLALIAAVAKIEAFNVANNASTMTLDDLTAAGVTGLVEGNLAAYKTAIAGASAGDANTTLEIQGIINSVNTAAALALAIAKIEAFNVANDASTMTIADLENAGVTGLIEGNLSSYKAAIAGAVTGGADTTAKIQAIIDGVS